MITIAWTHPDTNELTITTGASEADLRKNLGDEISSDDLLKLIRGSIHPQAIAPTDIDPATIPQDLTFRAAWAWNSSSAAIDIDLAKAQAVALAHMRAVREPLLAQLDVSAMRAVETNDTAALANVAAQKKALRDCTNPLKNMSASGFDAAQLAAIKAAMIVPGASTNE